ncbi:MAG: methylmalonyl Co-A mutase-associated GTPase MeaB [Myxococcales bacterium]|nr:methylmalonyl Co-A mutase-associated GTPase MeaB [Myxococcales bacterium]|tara:strand:+ start:2760 stop:3743 length:984 start_codon:yes stop_codon:yes gene_type:complete
MGTEELVQSIQSGSRRALAKAITLVESQKHHHILDAQALLAQLDQSQNNTLRVGISGPPGVGKSTFIEALGLYLIGLGKKVAVLAVDPTSPISGGSILGDKTRMERLSQNESAFIRPSASGGHLGGVARQTREALVLCEAAGYDVILIETVGVGQSEIEVAHMVDFFLLLLQPGGGDELQGVKKGILEMADLLLVNKADGELVDIAKKTQQEYKRAASLLRRSKNSALVTFSISALSEVGIDKVWDWLVQSHDAAKAAGTLAENRSLQAQHWMRATAEKELLQRFWNHPQVAQLVTGKQHQVQDGTLPPTQAALDLLQAFGSPNSSK